MSWVYFIQHGTAGAIKIGTTTGNPYARLRALQTGAPEPLRLLCAIPGDAALERELHERFRALRARPDGEWFRPEPILVAFIDGALAAKAEQPKPEPEERPLYGMDRDQVLAVAGAVCGYLKLQRATVLADAIDVRLGPAESLDLSEARDLVEWLYQHQGRSFGAEPFSDGVKVWGGGFDTAAALDHALEEQLGVQAEARLAADQQAGICVEALSGDLGPLADDPPLNAQGGSA